MESKSVFRQLLSAGLWVSGGVLLGRMAGFVREIAIASQFGVSEDADVVLFALTLPDFLISILLGGALAAALIPQYQSHAQKEKNALLLQSAAVVGLTFVVLALGLIAAAEFVVAVFAPGFEAEAARKGESLLAIVLWLLPLTALAGVTTGFLQAQGHFAVPALGTLIFNLTLIGALWGFLDGPNGLVLFAGAMIVGGLLRLLSQVLCLPKYGVMQGTAPGWWIDKGLLLRYGQALGAGSLLFLLPVIARALASLEGPGGFATLNYATKLIDLPMGVGLGVFSVVLLPKMSECFIQGRDEEGVSLARNGVLGIFAISYTLILIFAWWGDALTEIVYGWGAMSEQDTKEIAFLAVLGMTLLPAQGAATLLAATANARKDTALAFRASVGGLVVFLPVAWFAASAFGLTGIVASLILTYWVVMGYQSILLKKRHGIHLLDGPLALDLLRIGLVCPLALAPFALATTALESGLPGILLFASLAGVTLLFVSGAAIPRYREYLINRLRPRPDA
ncbi:putative Virulence factor MviN [Nitrospina gracilis 3/211]|uniref:Putative Virulence factor MviN n=1 Tax=Nitrospina gracilis (strain 3/211) TaxID=1266370 RepID=M1YW97_NITG3|nr:MULTISPECIES: lipid II flippase MurJ [Nitrospina]MCF8722793.1 murein biosynthesis integral membrane protein MurJ [Nitrospina sp. Nb-3]CCQ89747.1 putative Virulence factor MviN [Nitrospina gracilis 3/211]